MRAVGIIGGMSWESTLPYYRRTNELVPLFDTGELHAAAAVEFALR